MIDYVLSQPGRPVLMVNAPPGRVEVCWGKDGLEVRSSGHKIACTPDRTPLDGKGGPVTASNILPARIYDGAKVTLITAAPGGFHAYECVVGKGTGQPISLAEAIGSIGPSDKGRSELLRDPSGKGGWTSVNALAAAAFSLASIAAATGDKAAAVSCAALLGSPQEFAGYLADQSKVLGSQVAFFELLGLAAPAFRGRSPFAYGRAAEFVADRVAAAVEDGLAIRKGSAISGGIALDATSGDRMLLLVGDPADLKMRSYRDGKLVGELARRPGNVSDTDEAFGAVDVQTFAANHNLQPERQPEPSMTF